MARVVVMTFPQFPSMPGIVHSFSVLKMYSSVDNDCHLFHTRGANSAVNPTTTNTTSMVFGSSHSKLVVGEKKNADARLGTWPFRFVLENPNGIDRKVRFGLYRYRIFQGGWGGAPS